MPCDDDRGGGRTDLVVRKSAQEVTGTSFLLCFAHAARINNPKMCFFCHPMVSHPIQRSAALSNPLSSSRLCSSPQTDARRPKYLNRRDSLCTELCLTEASGERSQGAAQPKSSMRLLRWSLSAAVEGSVSPRRCRIHQKVSVPTMEEALRPAMLTAGLEVDYFLTRA